MSGMPLETCWAFNERWNNKFCYKVASCWLFLLGYLLEGWYFTPFSCVVCKIQFYGYLPVMFVFRHVLYSLFFFSTTRIFCILWLIGDLSFTWRKFLCKVHINNRLCSTMILFLLRRLLRSDLQCHYRAPDNKKRKGLVGMLHMTLL